MFVLLRTSIVQDAATAASNAKDAPTPTSRDLASLTVSEVSALLSVSGFKSLIPELAEEDIDGQTLSTCDENDMNDFEAWVALKGVKNQVALFTSRNETLERCNFWYNRII